MNTEGFALTYQCFHSIEGKFVVRAKTAPSCQRGTYGKLGKKIPNSLHRLTMTTEYESIIICSQITVCLTCLKSLTDTFKNLSLRQQISNRSQCRDSSFLNIAEVINKL